MAEAAEATDDVEALKKTPQYLDLKSKLGDHEWRIDNLYHIVDEDSRVLLFKRNAAQLAYSKARHSRDVITKARQLGFSTYIEMEIGDTCIFRPNITAGIVDDTLDDAKKKLQKIRFAYDRLPVDIKAHNPLIKKNTEELHWANGSKVTVGTSYRGDTPQILHVSELGKTAVDKPDQAREVRKGSLNAIHQNGWAVVESTAHGTAGEFYDLAKSAEARMKTGRPLSALEFKLHFYGWWMKREYRVANNLVVIPNELREYFAKINAQLTISGHKPLDANQMAWYAIQYINQGHDDMREEFPTVMEETFFNSLRGAYFKDEINLARTQKRIGLPVPYDPSRRVNTIWDIGEDCTAIIFHQTDGLRHRIIDYFEEEGGSLQKSAGIIEEKRRLRGFVYDKHYGPHDLNNRDWAHFANTRVQTAADLGVKFTVVPRVEVKADSIEAARRLLGLTWIDEEFAGLLVQRLENYRKKWNKALQVFSSDPVHNMASHGSDAYQQLAMGLVIDKPKSDDGGRRREERKGSPWAS